MSSKHVRIWEVYVKMWPCRSSPKLHVATLDRRTFPWEPRRGPPLWGLCSASPWGRGLASARTRSSCPAVSVRPPRPRPFPTRLGRLLRGLTLEAAALPAVHAAPSGALSAPGQRAVTSGGVCSRCLAPSHCPPPISPSAVAPVPCSADTGGGSPGRPFAAAPADCGPGSVRQSCPSKVEF